MHKPTPDQHYAPKLEDMPDVGERIASLIKSPIEKVPARTFFTENPFEVFDTNWYWLDVWGPMSKERFFEDLDKACQIFAQQADTFDLFRVYPITFQPEGRMGIGYMDWTGGSYPVDIRLFFRVANDLLDERYLNHDDEPIVMSGLAFYLTTLIVRQEEDDEVC